MPERLWIFGYASLLWNPGFPVAERRLASVAGYRRSFCMWSHHYRGTPEAPGLVLALDHEVGHVCHGAALSPPEGAEDEVLAYLRARELFSSAYREERLEVELAGGGRVEAIAYVIDRSHAQYCAALSLEEQARIIARAQGQRGTNTEYLCNTADHLSDIGIADPDLAWLSARVRVLSARGG
jgi:cation transport protein ChaC